MAYFLIENGQVIGLIDDPTALPGRDIRPGPDGLLTYQVYINAKGEILAKPEQPSPMHVWDESAKIWVELSPPSMEIAPIFQNWDGLLTELRGSAFFAKCFGAAERTLKANAAWTLLYGTLTRTHHLEDLMFSLFKMREAMSGIAAIGDFTDEEIEQVNKILTESGFELQLAPSAES